MHTTVSPTIRVDRQGGPEEMKLVDLPVGEPGPGEVRIRHHACGVNFLDVYHRSGVYPMPVPLAIGMEGAGVIEAVGEGVTHLAPGDRAAYTGNPPGAYALARVFPATTVVRLPDAISFEDGAAMMLKGLTVQYLFRRTRPQEDLAPGDFVLFHAAAGGVGLIACQWARAMGLRLIATAGSDEKCQLALDHGAAHAINYREQPDFQKRVREITGGQGLKVVYDAVGKDTWEGSLACLRPLGLMVSFGSSSGVVPPFTTSALAKGSLHLTRPTLFTHIATRESTQAMADDLFAMVTGGHVRMRIDSTYPLAEAAQAHRDLEARKTTGSIILVP